MCTDETHIHTCFPDLWSTHTAGHGALDIYPNAILCVIPQRNREASLTFPFGFFSSTGFIDEHMG